MMQIKKFTWNCNLKKKYLLLQMQQNIAPQNLNPLDKIMFPEFTPFIHIDDPRLKEVSEHMR